MIYFQRLASWLPGMDSNHDKGNYCRIRKLLISERPKLPSGTRNPYTGSLPAQQATTPQSIFTETVRTSELRSRY